MRAFACVVEGGRGHFHIHSHEAASAFLFICVLGSKERTDTFSGPPASATSVVGSLFASLLLDAVEGDVVQEGLVGSVSVCDGVQFLRFELVM